MSHLLNDLNDSQRKAVTTTDGPVLVVAGPGTGKTLTIVRRIAYLIHQGISPDNILAVTFTNRAAKEMKERTETLLGRNVGEIFIGTFHMLGLKIISERMGDTFVIYNREDQISVLKDLMKDKELKQSVHAQGNLSYPKLADRISRTKSYMDSRDIDSKELYKKYQTVLLKNAAFDFDDLILKPIEILSDDKVLAKYRNTFRHIIVDEYQDINGAQYRLLRLLAGSKGNICAVGDSDQAIYAFRGADVENFLNFHKEFNSAKTIHLKENYRSTGAILNSANTMIKHNQKRISKVSYPVREKGTHINVLSVPDVKAEGEIVIREIEERMGGTSHYQMMRTERNYSGDSYRFSDFAVIFRTNAQSKSIEEAFIASGIPFQILGEAHIPNRKIIEDIITYLNVIMNPMDDLNLVKVIAMSPGNANLRKIINNAEENKLTLYESLTSFSDKGERDTENFLSILHRMIDLKASLPFDRFLKTVVDVCALKENHGHGEDIMLQLETLAASYRDMDTSDAIKSFIHEISLLTPADHFDPRADAVTLMTMHMAKGLEFRVVFIAGVEEGLIPYTFKKDGIDLEEERRLFYVGMTRAKDELFLMHARKRLIYGQRLLQSPSPFLREIPDALIHSTLIPDRAKKQKEKDRQIGLF